MDISFIPMARCFVYLAAVIDRHSRRVLASRLSIATDTAFCTEAVEEAIAKYGTSEIFNTDQGSSTLKPGEADKLLKQYLAADAKLSDQTRKWISESRPVKLKSPLVELVLAVDKRQVPKIDNETREMLAQITDLIDEAKERIEAFDLIESTLTSQQQIAAKGSKAFDEAAQYLKFLSDARTKPEALLREIKVPKAADKPEVLVVTKMYDATSAVLAIGILLDVIAKALKKRSG